MLKLVRFIVSLLVLRVRSRAVLELENLALRHQLHVLGRQRPGRPRLFMIDRLLWVWLYRLWPRCLDMMVLVKPASVVLELPRASLRLCALSSRRLAGVWLHVPVEAPVIDYLNAEAPVTPDAEARQFTAS